MRLSTPLLNPIVKGFLKLDYEKAFDRVNLDFLEELLTKRGFNKKSTSWIHQITHKGFVGVKRDNSESGFFLTEKVLRRGDPLSHLLSNLVVDVLTRMLIKAASEDLTKDMCYDVCSGDHQSEVCR